LDKSFLGEPLKHAAINKYLDYEQICDRVGTGFNKLSPDEQTEISHDIRARTSVEVQGCAKNTSTTTQTFTTMQSRPINHGQISSRNTAGINIPLAAPSTAAFNWQFIPKHYSSGFSASH
jgi:hypothetical protein